MDFPGGPVVNNLPANAGDMGSIPDLGRFHMLWGPWATTTELTLCSIAYELRLLRLHAATRKSPCIANKIQDS